MKGGGQDRSPQLLKRPNCVGPGYHMRMPLNPLSWPPGLPLLFLPIPLISKEENEKRGLENFGGDESDRLEWHANLPLSHLPYFLFLSNPCFLFEYKGQKGGGNVGQVVGTPYQPTISACLLDQPALEPPISSQRSVQQHLCLPWATEAGLSTSNISVHLSKHSYFRKLSKYY